MSCLELADAVSAYLEKELDPGERDRFDAHFRGCQSCRLLVAQSQAVVGALRGLEDASKEAIEPKKKEWLVALFHEHGFHRPARPNPGIPLGLDGARAAPGDHLAYFWESEQDFGATVGFVAAGAAQGETCVLHGHEGANDRIEAATNRSGLDTATLRREGRLHFASGMRSADALLDLVGTQVDLAVDRGAPLVRILGNLGWGRPDWPDELDLLRFEARVTNAVRKLPVIVMCAYDVRRLPGGTLLLGGLECHPLIYRRGALRSNELYVPAEQFLGALPPTDPIDPPRVGRRRRRER
ncbi:MAG: MEDS domain-containing protein [Thermoanaerobaculia bacterium]